MNKNTLTRQVAMPVRKSMIYSLNLVLIVKVVEGNFHGSHCTFFRIVFNFVIVVFVAVITGF